MPFWRLYYHLVWATKDREPLIDADAERVLFPYMIATAANEKSYVYAIGGWIDHVHLIVSIPPNKTLADLVKLLKGGSSHKLKQHGRAYQHFAWQGSYGALTVGEKARPDAEAYVLRQKEHHTASTARAWLERWSDYDDGPDPADQARRLRDDSPGYEVDNLLDF